MGTKQAQRRHNSFVPFLCLAQNWHKTGTCLHVWKEWAQRLHKRGTKKAQNKHNAVRWPQNSFCAFLCRAQNWHKTGTSLYVWKEWAQRLHKRGTKEHRLAQSAQIGTKVHRLAQISIDWHKRAQIGTKEHRLTQKLKLFITEKTNRTSPRYVFIERSGFFISRVPTCFFLTRTHMFFLFLFVSFFSTTTSHPVYLSRAKDICGFLAYREPNRQFFLP
jgi:hypothetical protein